MPFFLAKETRVSEREALLTCSVTRFAGIEASAEALPGVDEPLATGGAFGALSVAFGAVLVGADSADFGFDWPEVPLAPFADDSGAFTGGVDV